MRIPLAHDVAENVLSWLLQEIAAVFLPLAGQNIDGVTSSFSWSIFAAKAIYLYRLRDTGNAESEDSWLCLVSSLSSAQHPL